jgi:hypothetical protein
MWMQPVSRRQFLTTTSALLAGIFLPTRAARAADGHPTPRPDITAAKVLTKADLKETPDLIPLFDSVREIPQIVDGIRCHCGCAGSPGKYSLLSCYEADGMARFCHICQGEGRLTARLHKAGKSLEEIRSAIDAQFG